MSQLVQGLGDDPSGDKGKSKAQDEPITEDQDFNCYQLLTIWKLRQQDCNSAHAVFVGEHPEWNGDQHVLADKIKRISENEWRKAAVEAGFGSEEEDLELQGNNLGTSKLIEINKTRILRLKAKYPWYNSRLVLLHLQTRLPDLETTLSTVSSVYNRRNTRYKIEYNTILSEARLTNVHPIGSVPEQRVRAAFDRQILHHFSVSNSGKLIALGGLSVPALSLSLIELCFGVQLLLSPLISPGRILMCGRSGLASMAFLVFIVLFAA